MTKQLEQFSGTLVVVRHAQSDANTGDLTPMGQNQARGFTSQLNKVLRANTSSREQAQLLTGPAPRLVETAQILADSTRLQLTILSRLSMQSATRRLPEPSPAYDQDQTIQAILSMLKPTTALAIIIAHSEMMLDLAYVHSSGNTPFDIYTNMTGYIVHPNGRLNKIG